MTVRWRVSLRTSGLSLAKLHVELLDRNEDVLASAVVDDTFGGEAVLQLGNVSAEKYFIRVTALEESFWTQGDYSVTIGDPSALWPARQARSPSGETWFTVGISIV